MYKDAYQVGCICLNCPSHVWLDEHGNETWLKQEHLNFDPVQWRWWMDRVEGKPLTPFPEKYKGPFSRDVPPETLYKPR